MSETEGFTKIPHDIMEALIRSNLSSSEARALLFIARQTWGWQKESDTIALRQFSNATGIERRNIWQILQILKDARLIVVYGNDTKAATYRINKNISEWCLSLTKTTAREKRKRRAAVVHKHDKLSSVDTTDLSCTATPGLSCTYTPSEETLKEKEKKDKESTALRAASLSNSDHPIKDTDRTEEVRKQKELSNYRNKMFKSGLYSSDELASFLGKTIEELMKIDTERVVQDFRNKRASSMNEADPGN